MSKRSIQWCFLDFTILINIYSLYLLYNWDNYLTEINTNVLKNIVYNTSFNIINSIVNKEYIFSLDQIGIIFILITTFIIPVAIISNWNTEFKKSLLFFYFLILLIEINSILIFYSNNLFFFFIFFEFMTIPTFFLIYLYGSNITKIRASIFFLIYSILSSTFLTVGIIIFMLIFKTSNLNNIKVIILNNNYNMFVPTDNLFPLLNLIWIFIFISFWIKIPLVPFQAWLPEAHAEAPTGVSIILAGIILKIGGYAIYRYCFPLFNVLNFNINIILLMCLWSIIYSTSLCMKKQNIKQFIAYTSINHMAISVVGLISQNKQGLVAGIYSIIQHSFLASSFFFLAGIFYEKYHTYNINKLWNFLKKEILISLLLISVTLINISFPFTWWFISEILILKNIFIFNKIFIFILLINILLTSLYSFWLLIKLIYSGKIIDNKINQNNININTIDITFLFSLIISIMIIISILLGIFPKNIIDFLDINYI